MRSAAENVIFLVSILWSVSGHDNELVSEHSLELTQSLNLGRQELIQDTCNRFPVNYTLDDLPASQLGHILIDDDRKLMYCYVPKVACTNWKRTLMIIAGKWNDSDVLSIPGHLAHAPGLFKNLSSVSKEDRDYMLENYHKIIFVRNPFERLLSAFRNKLEGDTPSAKYFQVERNTISRWNGSVLQNEIYERFYLGYSMIPVDNLNHVGKRIIKAFRANPSNESLELGHDVTFKEFVLFLTDKSKEELADIVNNEHWQPITSLCHPCLVKYTLVGKYETLLDDALLALNTIGASQIQFPRLVQTGGTAEKLRKYFTELDLPLIRRLYKLYKYDFRIFNYDLDNIIGFDLG